MSAIDLAKWRAVASLVLLASCGGAPARPSEAPGKRIDGVFAASGVLLHLHCEGVGSPVVVLDAGAGETGRTWKYVTPEVHRVTRACGDDHAGTAYSGPAPRHHTSRQMVEELRTLLAAARVEGPYVLVGHSFGGINAQLFAAQYPQEVVGMVLVDSPGEAFAQLWDLFTPEQMRTIEETIGERRDGLDLVARRESLDQLRAAKRPRADLPLVVLSRGRPDEKEPGETDEQAARFERRWHELQVGLTRLSSNSAHIVAQKANHFIQLQAPKLTAAAIREVVDAVRTRRRVDEATLAVLGADSREP